MVSSRDRIAPNCAIRHPVWPVVAPQRRVRFSARLAGVYRIRCHQRRARRAARASFSVFVSNLNFRVPRLRPIGERALTGPCGGEREAARKAQNRDLGYRSVAGASTFWSRCGPGLLDFHLAPGPDPGSSPGSMASGFWTLFRGSPNCSPQCHPSRALVSPRSNRRGFPQPPRGQPWRSEQ